MFGIFRTVERRHTNAMLEGGRMCSSVYRVMVARVVIFWVTVWTTESRYE